MGTDVQWLLERKHNNGQWIAVLTSNLAIQTLIEHRKVPILEAGRHPTWAAADRSYAFFTLLADLRNEGASPDETLASPDIPDDISEVTSEWLYNDGDVHTTSWADWRRMTSWSLDMAGSQCIKDIAASYNQDLKSFKTYLEEMLKRYQSLYLAILEDCTDMLRVLQTPLASEDGEPTYGIGQRSAHQQIEEAEILKGLQPIGLDTVRFFWGFDN